ncbi:MAG: LytR C-terminal domain-containing protein [Armatimonadetes bacterium]|nr:LytR C-terminal domain-containing protein [Armatimonadota bacterium]
MSDDRRPFDSDPSQLDVPRFTQPQPARPAPPPLLAEPAPARGARRRPVRWGRVSAVLVVLCLPPMLLGAKSAAANAAKSARSETPAAAATSSTTTAPTAAPVAASTHVTLYNGTNRTGLEQQATERLKAVGYTVSVGAEMAGLTPHSFVFHVDHPDAAAVVASALGLNAPPQAVVADYPPVVEAKTGQPTATTIEVVVILGEDYR